MKVTYTGRHVDLAPAQVDKIQEQFTKLAKLLDGKGRDPNEQQEAHVRLSQERYLHNAEVTVNFHHHSLVATASDPDLFTAIHGAVHRLESQAIKVTEKWTDGKKVDRKDMP
jgi:ribosomal subunit interface protein